MYYEIGGKLIYTFIHNIYSIVFVHKKKIKLIHISKIPLYTVGSLDLSLDFVVA